MVLRELRDRLYTEQINFRILIPMYRIAHQYGVEDLVKLCLLALAEADITSDLFYEVVDLAKLHDLPDLLKRSVWF